MRPRVSVLARAAVLTALVGTACAKDSGSTTATTAGTTTTGGEPTTDATSGTTQSITSITTIETIGDVSTSTLGTTGGTTGSTGPAVTTGLETGMFTDTGTGDDSTAGTSSSTGGGLGEGADCQTEPDACAPGLLCCYPCGIPDCTNKCSKPDPRTMMCPLLP